MYLGPYSDPYFLRHRTQGGTTEEQKTEASFDRRRIIDLFPRFGFYLDKGSRRVIR
jgi:hypothetical protein